jgi:hypothetical protein
MDPITLALSGLGLVGGLFGGRGQKTIDPKMLARLFGPAALSADTQTLFQTLAASPMFQQIMSQASATGTAAGNATRANFARAGLSGSGVGALGSAVSRGFGQNLILGARGNLWGTALSAANQNLMARMGLYGQSALGAQSQPSTLQSFGNALTGAAATGLTARLAPRAPVPPSETAVVSAPMRRLEPTDYNTDRYGGPYSR